jgi:hypothetical protein
VLPARDNGDETRARNKNLKLTLNGNYIINDLNLEVKEEKILGFLPTKAKYLNGHFWARHGRTGGDHKNPSCHR